MPPTPLAILRTSREKNGYFCMVAKAHSFESEELDRIIEMAWEDRTPFDAIEAQWGLKENDVRALMRKHMKRSSFEMWRKRVKGRKTKHQSGRKEDVQRFKSANQRQRPNT